MVTNGLWFLKLFLEVSEWETNGYGEHSKKLHKVLTWINRNSKRKLRTKTKKNGVKIRSNAPKSNKNTSGSKRNSSL